MNIVLIIIDTLRYDYIGAHGNKWIETPTLDRLASESFVFDRAFAASFPTIPHRTDVMTGKYGGPFHIWMPLPFDWPTLPRLLAEEGGYCTQLIHDTPHLVNGGHNFDWPFHAWTMVRGAEVDRPWIDDSREWLHNWAKDPLGDCLTNVKNDTRGAEYNWGNICAYMCANRKRENDEDWNCARLFSTASQFAHDNRSRENFFLWLDCFDPHEPWDCPPEYVLKYDKTPGYDGRIDPRLLSNMNDERLSDEARERLKRFYAAKVTWMDHRLGEFLDTLESTGLLKNTAVILTADHGTNLYERGRFGKSSPLHEQEAHVPMMVRLPEGEHARTNAIVQPQDIFATVCRLARVKCPSYLESYDMVETIKSGNTPRTCGLGGTSPGWTWKAGSPCVTVFKEEKYLLAGARADDCSLFTYGQIDPIDDREPVAELHAEALSELERRGCDSRIVAWIRNGCDGDIPQGVPCHDGWPEPPGNDRYFSRLYYGD